MVSNLDRYVIKETIEKLKQYVYMVELYWKEEKLSPEEARETMTLAKHLNDTLSTSCNAN